jgi:predicted nuclease of predicted toxin-antitoxin system
MKILLDENIDVRARLLFPAGMEVFIVRDIGWTGIKNGELIKLLADNNSDYWIVADKNIPFQQNTSDIPFKIIVLDLYRNTLKSIELLLPKILAVLNGASSNKVIIVNEK